jgi:hypothetical protein
VAKAHLDAHGIASTIYDAELANSWVYTNALGGVRLMVAPADLEAARNILAGDDTVDSSAVAEEDLISNTVPYCPDCHSKDIEIRSAMRRGWLRRWLNPGPPLHCRACGHDWRG